MRTTQWMAGTVWALVFAALGTAAVGAQTAQRSGGPSEGIKVHGQWVIEVRDPDGSLVVRREFANALDTRGSRNLARLLARAASGGRWVILLHDTTGGICPGTAAGGSDCFIAESGSAAPYDIAGPGLSTDLTVTVAGALQNEVVLSGSVRTLAAGNIYIVGTIQGVCPSTTAPQSCATASSSGTFSRKFLNDPPGAPIPVAAGQIVQVTVVFSFS